MGNEKETVAKNECVALAEKLCQVADRVIEQVAGASKVVDNTATAAYRLSAAIAKLNALRKDVPIAPPAPSPAKTPKPPAEPDEPAPVPIPAPKTKAPAPKAKKKVATKKKKAIKKKVVTKKKASKK